MPTYEYVCRSCGHQLEVVQKFSDAPLQTCKRCEGQLRKVYNAAGIIFKGSGYYVTDTRAGNGKAERAPAGAGAKDSTDSASSDKASNGSSSDSTGSDSSSSKTSSKKSDSTKKSETSSGAASGGSSSSD